MRVLRIILSLLCVVGVLFVAYLILPERFISSPGWMSDASADKVAYVENPLNGGRPCAANTTYVSQDAAQAFEGEGHPFEVNNDCADLQRMLVQAVRDRNVNRVRQLLAQGANVESPEVSMIDGYLPLQSAHTDDVEMLKLLLDNGADVNREFCCCADCSSSLTRAIRDGHADTARLLLQRGANPYYRPSFGDEELLSACELAATQNDATILDVMALPCDETLADRIAIRLRRLRTLVL